MAVPNRLRDQVVPRAEATKPKPLDWSPRRVIVSSAVGTAVIFAVSAFLIATPATGGTGVGVWLVANLILGAVLASRGGGRRAMLPALVGLFVGSVAMGIAAVIGSAVGILPSPANPPGLAGLLALLTIVPIVAMLFGAPVLLLGAVVGGALVDVRTERRHRAVARGDIPLVQGSWLNEVRSMGSEPMDDLALAKATADGGATTVIREYPGEPDPEWLLTADTIRLANIGYALTGVERHPRRSGLGWSLLTLGAIALDLLLFFTPTSLSFSDGVNSATRARVIATFQLRSPTHQPIPLATGDDELVPSDP